MGTWGTGISSNDTFADVYDDFFDSYNGGAEPPDISAKLIASNQETINDPDDANNFWFALALAQWECKRLEPQVLARVRKIIETGHDIEVWRELEADKNDLRKRQKVLDTYLAKLLSEKPKARARKRVKNVEPVYEKGTCLTFKLDTGNYGGAVVLEAEKGKGYALNLIALTTIESPNVPSVESFANARVAVGHQGESVSKPAISWFSAPMFKGEESLFEIVGKIDVKKEYRSEGWEFGFTSAWKVWLIDYASEILGHVRDNGVPECSPKISTYIRKKSFWKF